MFYEACQVRAWNLSSSSLGLAKFKPGTCPVQARNLSSSILELVKFKPQTCQVPAWDLPTPSRKLAKLKLRTCHVQAVKLSRSTHTRVNSKSPRSKVLAVRSTERQAFGLGAVDHQSGW